MREQAINGTWSTVMLQFACRDLSANRSTAPEKWEEHRSIHKVSSSSNKRQRSRELSAAFVLLHPLIQPHTVSDGSLTTIYI